MRHSRVFQGLHSLNMSFNQASFLAVDVIYGGLFNWALVFPTELYYLSSPQVWPVTGRETCGSPTWKPLRIVIVKNRGLGPNLLLNHHFIFSHRLHMLFLFTCFLTTSQKVHTLGQGQWKVTQHQHKFRAGPVFLALGGDSSRPGKWDFYICIFQYSEKPKQTCWPTQ